MEGDAMDDRPLQDVLKVRCYGCGALNDHGLKIKSVWDGDDLVCRWRAEPFQIGHPGFLYGGTIASVVDCHSVWTALATACRRSGHDLASGVPPFAYVTGRLSVSYLRPIAIDDEIVLRARVVDHGERKTLVTCRVFQQGVECANAEVVTVRTKLPS